MSQSTRLAIAGRIGVWLVVLMGGTIAADSADEPRSAAHRPEQEQVARLVQQLGSGRLADRLEAERALEALGPRLLPHLPAPDLISDPGARDALMRLRTRLERQLALESLEPTTVSLRGEFDLQQIIQEIESQTGNLVSSEGVPPAVLQSPIIVNWDRLRFWDAISLLEETGEIQFQPGQKNARAALVVSEAPPPLARSVVGAWRIDLIAAEPRPGLQQRLLRTRWRLAAEPRLRPLFADYKESAVEISAGGTKLEPFNPAASRQPEFDDSDSVEFVIDYLLGADQETRPLHASGQLQVEVAAAPQEVVFRNLTDTLPVERRRGSVTVALEDVTGADALDATARAGLTISVRYDAGGPAFESHRLAALHRQAWLELADGRRIPSNDGFEMTQEADGAVEVRYRFRDLPPDWRNGRLVYEAPTSILTISVPFELVVGETAPAEQAAPDASPPSTPRP